MNTATKPSVDKPDIFFHVFNTVFPHKGEGMIKTSIVINRAKQGVVSGDAAEL
ncbi:hypothetical protein [Dickeya sp. DW 0440]|uniref:hypothetical protein n=1 Tax=Dickeya sp. DW 0440 TaxID=1225785 RepID=UPI00039FC898|nr:hypothetical protein [Dickeya sp. DW 0440]